MIAQTVLVIVPVALWISSIHVDYPNRLGLIFVAILLGELASIFCFIECNILITQ